VTEGTLKPSGNQLHLHPKEANNLAKLATILSLQYLFTRYIHHPTYPRIYTLYYPPAKEHTKSHPHQ
jgi:hypothetical protein